MWVWMCGCLRGTPSSLWLARHRPVGHVSRCRPHPPSPPGSPAHWSNLRHSLKHPHTASTPKQQLLRSVCLPPSPPHPSHPLTHPHSQVRREPGAVRARRHRDAAEPVGAQFWAERDLLCHALGSDANGHAGEIGGCSADCGLNLSVLGQLEHLQDRPAGPSQGCSRTALPAFFARPSHLPPSWSTPSMSRCLLPPAAAAAPRRASPRGS
jgi:hypothetical protein